MTSAQSGDRDSKSLCNSKFTTHSKFTHGVVRGNESIYLRGPFAALLSKMGFDRPENGYLVDMVLEVGFSILGGGRR